MRTQANVLEGATAKKSMKTSLLTNRLNKRKVVHVPHISFLAEKTMTTETKKENTKYQHEKHAVQAAEREKEFVRLRVLPK